MVSNTSPAYISKKSKGHDPRAPSSCYEDSGPEIAWKFRWIMDNGSSHRGDRSVQRLQFRYANVQVVHGPVHASWLNQIEIYFSIIQRKVLTPNDFPNLEAVADRVERFERHYEAIAKPFEWKFTRDDLTKLMQRLDRRSQPLSALAA